MPNFYVSLRKGCSDAAIERMMKEITEAAYTTLENVAQRMVRVTVDEYEENCAVQGGQVVLEPLPTITFRVGPGRSYETRLELAKKMTEIVSRELNVNPQSVRVYIEYGKADHFAIGGKLKDFNKKVD